MIDAPDSEPPFRLSKEKKTEKELHWCEKAVFISKLLFDLKVKGQAVFGQEKLGAKFQVVEVLK